MRADRWHLIAAQEAPLALETINFRQLVKDGFASPLRIRQISWLEPDAVIEIKADRLALLRILSNLVDNSLKYGGDRLWLGPRSRNGTTFCFSIAKKIYQVLDRI